MTTTTSTAPTALLMPIRRILKVGAVAALVGLPAAALVGLLLGGVPGFWGGLIGMGLAVAFFAVTVLVTLFTSGMDAMKLGVWVLGSWLAKIVILIAVLAALDEATFYSGPALFASLLVGTIGCLVLEALMVTRTKVPYVEPR